MSPIVFAGIGIPVAVLLAAGFAAILFDGMWAAAVLALGLIVLAGLHVRQLVRLTRWADSELDTPVPEAHGAWGLAYTAIFRRVRSRALRQRDLATTMERFRSAVEALPEGMVILDATNRIEWANVRAQAHLGIDLARDTGQPLLNFVRQPEVVRYFETGDFTDSVVVDSLRDAGTTLAIQVVPFGVEERLLISRNITQIEAVARMRRDFIANVSHELKTPLTVISGFLETLQDLDLEPGQRTRFMQLMSEQARNMQRLVDDLLTLSALESEQNPVVENTFDVVPLMLELSADAKALSDAHKVVLDIGEPAMVAGVATSSRARSAISSATRSATRPTAGRSRSAGMSTERGGAHSASPTPGSASPPSTFRG